MTDWKHKVCCSLIEGLILGAALALAGSLVPGSSTVPIIAGGVNAVTSIAGNLLSDLTRKFSEKSQRAILARLQRGDEFLPNGELKKAFSKAIADILDQAASEAEGEGNRRQLREAAKATRENWRELFSQEDMYSACQLIQKKDVVEILSEKQDGSLELEDWQEIVRFCLQLKSSSGFSTKYIQQVALKLKSNFPDALKDVLKNDFADRNTGGKAFAGYLLSALPEVYSTINELRAAVADKDMIHLDRLGERISNLEDAVHQSDEALFQNLLEAFSSGFTQKIANLIQQLEVIETQTVLIPEINERTKQIEAGLKKLQQGTHLSEQNRVPHNLPRSGVREFVGRQKEMTDLHRCLRQKGPQLRIIALKGMPGVGKSELALQYAFCHRDLRTYPGGICWLDLRAGSLGIQIIKFAHNQLKWAMPEGIELGEQIVHCWRDWPIGEVLLIYDNAQDYSEVESWLPPNESRFRVLITSRERFCFPVETMELHVLSEEAAITLLRVLVGKDRIEQQSQKASEICLKLGCLTLAVELVGRYLVGKPDWSLGKMLQRLDSKSLSAEALAEPEEGMTARLGVRAAFELSWEELDKQAQQLASLLSLFGSAPIPWLLVENCLPQWDTDRLEEVRDKQLCQLSLLERPGKGLYQLHPLIRVYFIQKSKEEVNLEELKEAYCRVMVKRANNFPAIPIRQEWEKFAPEVPHIAEVANEDLLKRIPGEDLIWPFVGIGRFYSGQGAYAQAGQWYKQCLKECRTRLGEEHLAVASSLQTLAGFYRFNGRYGEAELLFLQALQISRKLLGEEHQEVAQHLHSLARLYQIQGRYTDSEGLQLQALDMRKRLFGEQHPTVAESLSSLAYLYQSEGRYAEAENLCLESLTMRKRLFGVEHIEVASSLHALARLYSSQLRCEEAEPLACQALQIRQRLLGEEHEQVAQSLHSLAELYQLQGRSEVAELLSSKGIEIYKRLLGEEHLDVASSLHTIACLYQSQSRYPEADQLFRQAIEMYKKLLGEEHPAVAGSLHSLAHLYQSQGCYPEAEQIYLQAIDMRKRLLSETHPDIAQSLNNLAGTYQSQGRKQEAQSLYLQALQILHKSVGSEHPTTICVAQNYYNLIATVGKHET